jgi:galactose mutarotase-like enzyme
MISDSHTIGSNGISATVKAAGAELCSLKNIQGLELLWQAGLEWPRHAPLLFPIVGRLKNDQLRHDGKVFPMRQHGFARDLRFDWLERGADSCKLALSDNAETRSHYPFAFRLTVTYTLSKTGLNFSIEVANTGEEILPASIGVHPAFNWPLLAGLSKGSYCLTFSNQERAPIRRLKDGLLQPASESTPIVGKVLALSERLFDDDAVILDQPASRSVRYAADYGPSVEVSWNGFRELRIWSKVGGAAFLYIQRWYGFASPWDFDGEFNDKPGLMRTAPAATRSPNCHIRIE